MSSDPIMTSLPEWIREQDDIDGVVGDLAEMVKEMPDWPDEASSVELYEYLPRSMHRALDWACAEYWDCWEGIE